MKMKYPRLAVVHNGFACLRFLESGWMFLHWVILHHGNKLVRFRDVPYCGQLWMKMNHKAGNKVNIQQQMYKLVFNEFDIMKGTHRMMIALLIVYFDSLYIYSFWNELDHRWFLTVVLRTISLRSVDLCVSLYGHLCHSQLQFHRACGLMRMSRGFVNIFKVCRRWEAEYENDGQLEMSSFDLLGIHIPAQIHNR